MDHAAIIVIILIALISLLLRLYYSDIFKGDLRRIFGGAASTRASRRNRAPAGNMRVKDLAKHPRTRSEAEIIRYFEETTGKKFPTVYPKWLVWKGRGLELDGFNNELMLGIEFSGPLHTKWNPRGEPYEEYFNRIIKDIVKKKLCKRHGVSLVVIDASLPANRWRDYVRSRLFVLKIVKDRPCPYIDEQSVEPYRNEQIERDLGLESEFVAAAALN